MFECLRIREEDRPKFFDGDPCRASFRHDVRNSTWFELLVHPEY